MKKPRTEHISAIKLSGNMNNNKMERFNGEIRDRERTTGGLKAKDTPILSGYRIFHNYIRSHEGLNGKTPAEACGIEVKGSARLYLHCFDGDEKVALRAVPYQKNFFSSKNSSFSLW